MAAGLGNATGQINSLIQFLLQRQKTTTSNRLFWDLDFDADNRCNRVFFMSSEMADAFRRNGQFLIMDATCKTTRFAMQLVLLVGIDETMQSTLFAAGLIAQEDIDSYTWLLRAVQAVVGLTSFTDHALRFSFTCDARVWHVLTKYFLCDVFDI